RAGLHLGHRFVRPVGRGARQAARQAHRAGACRKRAAARPRQLHEYLDPPLPRVAPFTLIARRDAASIFSRPRRFAMNLEKVVYTAPATATGGRDGRARSSDGRIDVVLKPPKEMGGTGEGVNPEQLFAAGYSACFIGALKFVGGQEKIAVPADTSIE